MSKSSARRATQLLKLRPYKTTVIHTSQPCNPASRVHFCSWFLQSVIKGEINLQFTFSNEAWFHSQRYINTQNNRYWSSQNSHLTHQVLLLPVKVGVWCAVSARMIVGPVFFNETINCEKYIQVILWQFFPDSMAGFSKTQLLPILHVCLYRLCPMSSGTELSEVVFGQHVHPILILVIFFFWGCLKDKVYNSNS
jgi:hypothetical protein